MRQSENVSITTKSFLLCEAMAGLLGLKRGVGNEEAKAARIVDVLGHEVLPHLPDGNLAMSPYALGTVLGLILAGARNKTKDQLLRLLNLEDEDGIHEGLRKALFLDALHWIPVVFCECPNREDNSN